MQSRSGKSRMPRFDKIMLKTKTVAVEAKDDGLYVKFEGRRFSRAGEIRHDPASSWPHTKRQQDWCHKAGVAVTDRGFINVDAQMRKPTSRTSLRLATSLASPCWRTKRYMNHTLRRKLLRVKIRLRCKRHSKRCLHHPEVAWVGVTEAQTKAEGRKIEAAKFPYGGIRSRHCQRCRLWLHQTDFDAETHRVIGGAIVGPNAGDMIGEVCLAIEMGCDSVDIGKTIHRTQPWRDGWHGGRSCPWHFARMCLRRGKVISKELCSILATVFTVAFLPKFLGITV